MNAKFFKNITVGEAQELSALVQYAEGQVVSRTLVQNENVSVTLFAFDQGEEIGTHSAAGDAFVYILDGMADITVGETTSTVNKHQAILMPADIPHSLLARERFKMMLIIVR